MEKWLDMVTANPKYFGSIKIIAQSGKIQRIVMEISETEARKFKNPKEGSEL